ncbi:MAG: hypothetical protein H0U02_06555 [Rubrobacter sp.]|nr:hypothetical protein [Rubrobacter sp.]
MLNDPICLELVRSMSFADSKRPITKKLLQRIDLRVLLDQTDKQSLLARAEVESGNIDVPLNWQNVLDSTHLADLLFAGPTQDAISTQMSLKF